MSELIRESNGVIYVARSVAEAVQNDLREALRIPDLPVIDVKVKSGDWVIMDDEPNLTAGNRRTIKGGGE